MAASRIASARTGLRIYRATPTRSCRAKRIPRISGGKFDSVHSGGPWYKGVRNQCRPKIYTHDEGFYYYFLGFRCCAEADGKPTEPRTPKQIKGNWPFERVERIAGFTKDQR